MDMEINQADQERLRPAKQMGRGGGQTAYNIIYNRQHSLVPDGHSFRFLQENNLTRQVMQLSRDMYINEKWRDFFQSDITTIHIYIPDYFMR